MKNLLATLMICAVSASAFAATTAETKAPAKEAKVAAPTTDAKAHKPKQPLLLNNYVVNTPTQY